MNDYGIKKKKYIKYLKQELIVIKNKNFEYDNLDKEMAKFLQQMKQYEIFKIFINIHTEIGRILKEAQEG
ncbi:hypothetical protein LKV13_02180 [Borrelia sp. BU AG58]|uniref:hypothetical protein n=1 Tax=Borrelia sp. BU AG58 TaxID=2887345 RepID=UPI001E5F74B7|nr:hypothetical protein [Borrelia sp. BU AG58]UER67607.1 hypothetical protein LKV13_02180 [Borrelia sp. BU AG58]